MHTTLLDLLHRRLLRFLAASGLMLFVDTPASDPAPAADPAAPTAPPAADPASVDPAPGTPAADSAPADPAPADDPAKAGLKTPEAFAEEQAQTLAQLQDDWKAQTASDPEIGGVDGTKLTENLAVAHAAMKASTTDKLQVLLDKSGLGNHPEMIRHFLKIAPAFAPDKHVPGGRAAGTKADAQAIYARSNMNP